MSAIPHYDREDAFFYLDPPYFSSEYVYDVGFGWEQHVLMRDILAGCKGRFLLSQSDFPEVRELYNCPRRRITRRNSLW